MMRNWKHTLGVATRRDPLDQPDLLGPEELLPVAAGHSGFPEATDGLAYEPVQRLLAVSFPSAPPLGIENHPSIDCGSARCR